jgi:hypothetical protein
MSSGENSPRNYSSGEEGSFEDSEKIIKLESDEILGMIVINVYE